MAHSAGGPLPTIAKQARGMSRYFPADDRFACWSAHLAAVVPRPSQPRVGWALAEMAFELHLDGTVVLSFVVAVSKSSAT